MDSVPFAIPGLDGGAWLLVATGLLARIGAAVETAAPTILPGVGIRSRVAAAVLLAGAALPMALASAAAQAPTWTVFLGTAATEACLGVALGLAVAALVGAVSWAGEILGLSAGLSWSDGAEEEAAGSAAGMPRIARCLALAAFLSAGGLEGTVASLIDGVRTLPVGSAAAPTTLAAIAVRATASAVEIAVSLALPVLAGLLVFHLVAAIVLRASACDPGPGLLHAATALVLLAILWSGAAHWSKASGPRLLPALGDLLDPLAASVPSRDVAPSPGGGP